MGLFERMCSVDFAIDVAVGFRCGLREVLEGNGVGILCVDHLETVEVQ